MGLQESARFAPPYLSIQGDWRAIGKDRGELHVGKAWRRRAWQKKWFHPIIRSKKQYYVN